LGIVLIIKFVRYEKTRVPIMYIAKISTPYYIYIYIYIVLILDFSFILGLQFGAYIVYMCRLCYI
jgi:hypothetical protein